jgi:MFS family permease
MWTGALVSNIGTWMETVGITYYVAHTTGRASWSAVVGAAGFLPSAVISPIGAAMADRLDRRRVLMLTNAGSSVIAGILAVFVGTGRATPGALALLAFVAGAVNSFGFPSFQTILPELVPRDQLVGAVGLSNAQWNLGRIVGPTFAAVAISLGGVAAALWCNAISFFAVIVAVAFVSVPDREVVHRPILHALADGVRFARSNTAMRRMLVLFVTVTLIGSPFIAFVSQMGTNVFHGDARSTSVLVTGQGIGAVIAAFSLGPITRRFGLGAVLGTASLVIGPVLVLYGIAPRLWLAAAALVLVGLAYGTTFTACAGVAQHAAPDEMRGRVLAVNSFVLGAFYPIGTLVQGAIADRTSLRTVTAGSGALLLVVILLVRWIGRPLLGPIDAVARPAEVELVGEPAP